MAILRDDPYRSFNFRVNLPGGDGAVAGFCEVTGLSAEVEVAEYRSGSDKVNSPRKLLGLTTYGDVTLKRGIIGATDLWEWFSSSRDGMAEPRDVVIELLSEDRSDVVMSWKLSNARPIKYTGPDLKAGGSEVAIEELVLAVERLDIE